MSEQPSIEFQMLTPERLRWVLDIGESTEAQWRESKPPVISFFRQGRLIRYAPADVLAGIARNTVRARGGPLHGTQMFTEEHWARIGRLISDQVGAHMKLTEVGLLVPKRELKAA